MSIPPDARNVVRRLREVKGSLKNPEKNGLAA